MVPTPLGLEVLDTESDGDTVEGKEERSCKESDTTSAVSPRDAKKGKVGERQKEMEGGGGGRR